MKSKYCNYIGVYTNRIVNYKSIVYIHIHPTRPNNEKLTFRHLKTIIQFKTKLNIRYAYVRIYIYIYIYIYMNTHISVRANVHTLTRTI